MGHIFEVMSSIQEAYRRGELLFQSLSDKPFTSFDTSEIGQLSKTSWF
jgi:hypothetical protein